MDKNSDAKDVDNIAIKLIVGNSRTVKTAAPKISYSKTLSMIRETVSRIAKSKVPPADPNISRGSKETAAGKGIEIGTHPKDGRK